MKAPATVARLGTEGREGYNLATMSSSRRALLVMLAVLVAAFVALHPYLDEEAVCGFGGCPDVSQSSHATHVGFSTVCLVAVLVASRAVVIFATFRGRRRVVDHWRPVETYLSPDPPPPRVLPVR